jgi:oligosaccharide repeat unit polymerase
VLLASLVGLYPVLVWVVRPRSPLTFEVYAAAAVWLLTFPALFQIILGGDASVSLDRTQYVAIFVLLSNTCWIIGRALSILASNKKAVEANPGKFTNDVDYKRLTVVFFLIGCVGFALQVVAIPAGFRATELARSDILDSKSAVMQTIGAYLFLGALLSLALTTLLKRRTKRFYVACVAGVGVMSLLLHLLYRSRTELLAFAVLLVMPVFPRYCSTVLRRALVSISICAALYLFAAGVQLARGYIEYGSDSYFDALHEFSLESVVGYSFEEGDLSHIHFFYDALDLFPDHHPYLLGTSYFSWLLAPIPRSVFPQKPQDTQVIFCEEANPAMAGLGGTIPPSIYGDAYINFGPFGILVFVVWGFFANRLSHVSDPHSPSAWASLVAMTMGGPHFARGAFNNAMCLTIASYALSWAVYWALFRSLLRDSMTQRQPVFTADESQLPRRYHRLARRF